MPPGLVPVTSLALRYGVNRGLRLLLGLGFVPLDGVAAVVATAIRMHINSELL